LIEENSTYLSLTTSRPLTIGDPVNGDRSHPQLITGWRCAGQVTFMLPNGREACNNLASFRNLIFDYVVTRRRPPEKPEIFLQSLSSCPRTGPRGRIVVGVILGHQLIQNVNIGFVNLFIKTSNKRFVLIR
jgi:hypothetical protein